MRVSFKVWLGALAGAVALSGAASAELKSALTADELQTILSNAGLSPSMAEDTATGAPVARGVLGEDITFWVRALDCSGAPLACENFVFFANFDLGRPPTDKDYRIANAFKDRRVFGRAYVLPGRNQIGVDYVVELGGGVSMDHITRNVSRWADVVAAFINDFRAGHGAS